MNMAFSIDPVIISGKEVYPVIEGGKGISISSGQSSGAFAAAGAVGTFSGVNANFYDNDGKVVPYIYKGKTRKERHLELVDMGIKGGIAQAKIARDIAGKNGIIHMNILWEMGGAEQILHGILKGANGLINGVTCGAGMPYKLSDIAAQYNIFYYPIVSSMRALRALWKRSYFKFPQLLGGVVYEDPWLAGGHNGLSNNEDPESPEDPYPRVVELRKFMNEVGLHNVPIIMAGGVWHLNEWSHWLNNDEIGKIAFQFGTRPILTQESPVSDQWKRRLLSLRKGEIYLNRYSPTGFYSSAVENDFIKELQGRERRQVHYANDHGELYNTALHLGPRGRAVYIAQDDLPHVKQWMEQGYDEAMKTPSSTLIFVTKERSRQILTDQIECMGCLSHCKFSNWKDHDDYSTGKKADPRSFCIQKTLQNIANGADVENELMFSGHNAYRFAEDEFYKNGFIPTVKQLVERICSGY
jgi:nitronate monooxygenase